MILLLLHFSSLVFAAPLFCGQEVREVGGNITLSTQIDPSFNRFNSRWSLKRRDTGQKVCEIKNNKIQPDQHPDYRGRVYTSTDEEGVLMVTLCDLRLTDSGFYNLHDGLRGCVISLTVVNDSSSAEAPVNPTSDDSSAVLAALAVLPVLAILTGLIPGLAAYVATVAAAVAFGLWETGRLDAAAEEMPWNTTLIVTFSVLAVLAVVGCVGFGVGVGVYWLWKSGKLKLYMERLRRSGQKSSRRREADKTEKLNLKTAAAK